MVNRTIQVTTNDATRVQVATSNTTQVRRITVGTPIRRVSRSAIGSVMVYNSSTTNWTSTINLENQNISGGQY
jgi:hypothetical protein